jgi:hypothetical protein
MLPFLCKAWGRGVGGEIEDQKREKYDSWHTAAKNQRKLLFWSHCVRAGLALIASVHNVYVHKVGHVMCIFAVSRNVHSLIKFSTEKWLYLCSNIASGCATVYKTCHCYLTVEAEVDLRPIHADFRWQSGTGTGFSLCPSCFPSQHLSSSAPNSYFVHLPPMLCDPTNWHHVCPWRRALHGEQHHKHDMRVSLERNLAMLV